jgi:transketolase
MQGSEVTLALAAEVLPRLEREGVDVEVLYVASAELFDALPPGERERIFPEARAREAMAITGFTLATTYRWVRSERGRAAGLHAYSHGRCLGSGPGSAALHEAGLDAEGQYAAIRRFLDGTARAK